MTPGGDGMGEGGTKVLGTDPVTNLEVTLRSGRFGPYVQLGEAVEEEKPKRSGLPKGTELSSVDLAFALGLLALPREVGLHPETGEPIKAGVGRFGPYVQHEKTYANLETGDDVLTIGLNRAVTLIEEKKLKGPSSRRFGADPGRSLGDHPVKGGPIVVKNGRYGPYVSHAGVNATLTGDKTPETITLEEAVGLIDARAEAGGGSRARRKAPPRKAASGAKAKTPQSRLRPKSLPRKRPLRRRSPAAKKVSGAREKLSITGSAIGRR